MRITTTFVAAIDLKHQRQFNIDLRSHLLVWIINGNDTNPGKDAIFMVCGRHV